MPGDIALVRQGDAVLLPVRALAGARRDGVAGLHAGRLKVAVSAPAEKGRANEALVETIARAFGLKRSQVELASGPTSNQKVFRLSGISLEAVEAKLASLLGADGSA